MIRLYIGSAYDPTEIIADEEKSVKELYAENNITLAPNAMVTLNSRRLGDAELTKPIKELDVKSEDVITITEKYSSSRI